MDWWFGFIGLVDWIGLVDFSFIVSLYVSDLPNVTIRVAVTACPYR